MNAIPRILNRIFLAPVDARPYAAVRIAFAFAALLNLLDVWKARAALLSDTGLFQRPDSFFQWNTFSLFYRFHSPEQVTCLIVAAAVAIVLQGAGLFTRAASTAVWVWTVSYSNGMYPALSASDGLFRALSFLIMLSPCGDVWSLDAARRVRRSRGTLCPLVPSYGLVLMRVQLTVVYLTTFLSKIPDPGWISGDAVGYFLLSVYTRHPLEIAAAYPRAIVLLSYGTLAVELMLPWLLWNRSTRLLGFLLGFGLHGGILAVSRLWVFSLITMVSYLCFLDSRDIGTVRSSVLKILRVFAIQAFAGDKTILKEQPSHATARRTVEA